MTGKPWLVRYYELFYQLLAQPSVAERIAGMDADAARTALHRRARAQLEAKEPMAFYTLDRLELAGTEAAVAGSVVHDSFWPPYLRVSGAGTETGLRRGQRLLVCAPIWSIHDAVAYRPLAVLRIYEPGAWQSLCLIMHSLAPPAALAEQPCFLDPADAEAARRVRDSDLADGDAQGPDRGRSRSLRELRGETPWG